MSLDGTCESCVSMSSQCDSLDYQVEELKATVARLQATIIYERKERSGWISVEDRLPEGDE